MARNLGVLRTDFEASKVLADNQESRLRFYETRAHSIAMGYLIWERFFFFAISQASSSSLNCLHWWMVLGLSLSCTFVFLLFLLEAVTMLYRTQNLLDIICKEQTYIWQQILEARNQDDGFGFNFGFYERTLSYDSFRLVERKVYICAIACALLAVTAFELYACKYLLCH